MTGSRTLFAGIGSPHGDDRIGWLVADALQNRMPSGLEIRQASTPSHLLDWLAGINRLVICDACIARINADRDESARLHRWEWPVAEVTMLRSAGSHAFGLPQVLQLAERLGTLPRQVIVFGIEGSSFDAFAELSPALHEEFDAVVDCIADELEAARYA
jgi:hydrogenase maturation protease